MYAWNQFLPRSFRTGGADRGCDTDSCQDPGRGGGVAVSESSGSAVRRDFEVMLTVDTLGRSGWTGLPAAGTPRRREASDTLTAVSNDSVEAEVSNSVVLLPML
jgi:hypothetical protein